MPPSVTEDGAAPFSSPAAARAYDRWFETASGRYAETRENELLARALGGLDGVRLLDVGSGPGRQLSRWAPLCAYAVGIEPAAAMLARAKVRLAGAAAALVQGRAEALPFRDGVFDVVTLVTSLEFMADPAAALREARRVCRRRLVVAVLNAWSLSALIRRAKRNLGPNLFRSVRFYTPNGLARTLAPYVIGPVKLAATLHFFPLYPRPLRRPLAAVDRWLSRRFIPWGAFVVAAGNVPRKAL